MKRSLVPVVLLAAPLTAAAGGSGKSVSCDVMVQIDKVATQSRGWADSLAKAIREEGASPAGACVSIDEGARNGVLQKKGGGFSFIGLEQDGVASPLKPSGDDTVHLQFHGSDFNAA